MLVINLPPLSLLRPNDRQRLWSGNRNSPACPTVTKKKHTHTHIHIQTLRLLIDAREPGDNSLPVGHGYQKPWSGIGLRCDHARPLFRALGP